MSQIIQNKIYTIYGKPGSGKTLFATYLCSLHKRIYANWDIKLKGKVVSNRFKTIDELNNIQFSEIKGCAALDEVGVNNNARRSGSDSNLEFGQFLMLGRKKNLNIIQISQLERMMDVYGRELSECSFTMHSWYISHDKLMFEFEVTHGNEIVGSKYIDLFRWMQEFGYEYDTLESGKIEIKNKSTGERIDLLTTT